MGSGGVADENEVPSPRGELKSSWVERSLAPCISLPVSSLALSFFSSPLELFCCCVGSHGVLLLFGSLAQRISSSAGVRAQHFIPPPFFLSLLVVFLSLASFETQHNSFSTNHLMSLDLSE